MKKAISLILSIPLIVFLGDKGQAQQIQSTSDRPYLALVKGDTSNNSCSFTSGEFLQRTADIVQGLLFVTPQDNRDQVLYKMRFAPDQYNSASALQWTALAQSNYTKAVVSFRGDVVQNRTFTMAINYKQPNQRECQWEVRQPQQQLQQQPQSQQQQQ
ncbi:hypothetical protein NIES4071_85360 [Calothrix sp. NIES-4071]|nr:hypothetical protein NIES4071_85360 [Calothrix sp. NIES-4071]BAZ62803.1 hypothetical protein NIES4105_85290 [Calothrix sp. NIES-4105]